jgi:hypothetical protein
MLLIMAATALLGRPPFERTAFKDMPADDPVREIVQTVLGSKFYALREEFTAAERAAGGYAAAWDRAKRYFPASAYFVLPGTYFMTHGFDPDGRLFIEIHESAYLRLCVENRRTFTPDSVAGAYGRMRAETDGLDAAAFRDKVGRLETFFRDEGSQARLRKALGEGAYLGLLEGLRDEDYHMLAGGLMHEGTHAGLDDALVARLQAEFAAGRRPVQWDELRAFMAEVGYHGSYCRWAGRDIAGDWDRIEGLLGELESLRRKPSLRPGPDLTRLEKFRAGAWACAALVRLRMREIWQSVRRMQDLAGSFRREYLKGPVPPDVDELLAAVERDGTGFAAASGEAIQATELAVRALEEILDRWGEWAAGRRPFPPPVTDSQAVARRAGEIRWPDAAPAMGTALALMKKAGEALEKERTPS